MMDDGRRTDQLHLQARYFLSHLLLIFFQFLHDHLYTYNQDSILFTSHTIRHVMETLESVHEEPGAASQQSTMSVALCLRVAFVE
jgi:hypothetical protein